MTVLVTGATGRVGRTVVGQLTDAGVPVRALSRRPERARRMLPERAEVHAGDLLDPESLDGPLEGARALYLFPEPRSARRVVELARRAGVERVVVLSSGSVEGGYDTDYQYPVEQAAEHSGMVWTHLRPGEFMANLLHVWAPAVRADRRVRYPDPDVPANPVHEADIAAVAVAALTATGDEHAGRAYLMNGPAPITAREQVRLIGEALGEEVGFEEVDRAEGRRILHSYGGWAADNADFLMGFAGFSEGDGGLELTADQLMEMARPLGTVDRVLGRPALDFARWARDHVGDFR